MVRRCALRKRSAPEQLEVHQHVISHRAEFIIVLAAMTANLDYLLIFNRHHFTEDPTVAKRTGIATGTPGEVLAWLRQLLVQAT